MFVFNRMHILDWTGCVPSNTGLSNECVCLLQPPLCVHTLDEESWYLATLDRVVMCTRQWTLLSSSLCAQWDLLWAFLWAPAAWLRWPEQAAQVDNATDNWTHVVNRATQFHQASFLLQVSKRNLSIDSVKVCCCPAHGYSPSLSFLVWYVAVPPPGIHM